MLLLLLLLLVKDILDGPRNELEGIVDDDDDRVAFFLRACLRGEENWTADLDTRRFSYEA